MTKDMAYVAIGGEPGSAPIHFTSDEPRSGREMVTTGAIDAEAFLAAHGEVFATFSKIQPFLDERRKAGGEPDFCKHVEATVMTDPNAQSTLTRRREATRAVAKSASSAGDPSA